MKNILIIDDHAFSLRLIAHVLSTAGYQVETARNGRLGLDLIRRLKPNLVITDLVMPGLHGFEVIREIRKDEPPLCDVPFVVLTDDISREAVMHSRSLGAAGFVSKLDFDVAPFLERISALVSGSGTPGVLSENDKERSKPEAELRNPPSGPGPKLNAPDPQEPPVAEANPAQPDREEQDEAPGETPGRDAGYKLPRGSKVQKLFFDLLDRDITVEPAGPTEFDPNQIAAVGLFEDPEGQPAAALVADLAMACFAGCALSMIAPVVARDEIGDRRIEGETRENFSEIASIVASLFNGPDLPNLKLGSVFILPGEPVPATLLPTLTSADQAASFNVGISDYGQGRLTLHIAN